MGTEVTITDYFGTTQYLTLPRSVFGWPVTKIKNNAFNGPNNIKELYIPNTIKEIGNSAFVHCMEMTKVTFEPGSSLSVLNPGVFSHCYKLTSISIPDSVRYIEGQAFACSIGLQSVIFSSNSKLAGIGRYAFYDCESLERFAFPASVTSIGDSAFNGSCEPSMLVFYGSNPPTFGTSVFGGNNITDVLVPNLSVDRYKIALMWQTNINMNAIRGF